MNYEKIYDQFISKMQTREVPSGYTERHHILPKCLGGQDTKNNLVPLTPDEHFFAHLLLAKIHGPKLWAGMAFFMLVGQRQHNQKYMAMCRRWESVIKKHLREVQSGMLTNRWQNPEFKAKMQKVHQSPEYKKKMSDNAGRGAKHSQARVVRCIDTGEVFGTIKDAAARFGVSSVSILKTCKGVRKKTAGHRFEYLT